MIVPRVNDNKACLGTFFRQPVVTVHAIERYQERVNRRATAREAAAALTEMVRVGRRRPRARRWMRGRAPQPGCVFVYAATVPGVCLVVKDRTVLTVLSKALCRVEVRDPSFDPEPRGAAPGTRLSPRDLWVVAA